MVRAITRPLSTPILQQNDIAPQRKKRSIDGEQEQPATIRFGVTAANDGPRRGGSGLDSLGKGNLL